MTELSIKDIELKYKDSNYKDFKEDLANIVADTLKPIQEKYQEIINSPYLDEVLDQGRHRASEIARKKMFKVYKRIGLGRVK